MRSICYLFIVICLTSSALSTDFDLDLRDSLAAFKHAENELERRSMEAFKWGAQSPAPFSRRAIRFGPEARDISDSHYKHLEAANFLAKKRDIPFVDAVNITLRQSTDATCNRVTPSCTVPATSRYRSIDGTCNNIANPLWGATNIAMRRVIGNAYDDRFSTPRGGFNSYLPNARLLSTQIHPDQDFPHTQITHLLVVFGQFTDHDLTLTPEPGRKCCSGEPDRDCWPISIPSRDPFYSQFRQTCLDFTRSTPYCLQATATREQFNALTAFVDGSQVYGSSSTLANQLRLKQGGFLRESSRFPSMLPTVSEISGFDAANHQGTFVAGDGRVNIMPDLVAIHTVWMREHNRLASVIGQLRPTWNDEKIYQEARRILSAELQNIVYNEYLPALLGSATMNAYQLYSTTRSSYNSKIDPSIFNSFATAAYRFGHTLIQGLLQKYNRGSYAGSALLRDHYFKDTEIIGNGGRGIQEMLEGLMATPAQSFDRFITQEVTNFLFKESTKSFGEDLIARNIQRGRDHGVAGYTAYRKYCLLSSPTSWSSKPAEITQDKWNLLSTYYSQPADIDLFVASLLETPLPGSILGATFNCLVAVQFQQLKLGDRYFFSHISQSGSFSEAQFSEIKRRRLGDIICDVTDITTVQEQVFYGPGISQVGSNRLLSCSDARVAQDVSLLIS